MWAIGDFVGQNVVEIADTAAVSHQDMLRELLDAYNARVEQAEVDPALRIDVK